jgi:hypothetical protein
METDWQPYKLSYWKMNTTAKWSWTFLETFVSKKIKDAALTAQERQSAEVNATGF